MGFQEMMPHEKPEQLQPPAPEAEADVEAGPLSPEFAAEAREAKEHLSALEKAVDDPHLDEKLEKLSPDARKTYSQRLKELGALCKDTLAEWSEKPVGRVAVDTALEGLGTVAKLAGVGPLFYLGISAASLHYVWKRLRERATPQAEA